MNLKIAWGYATAIVVKKLLKLPRFKNKHGVLQFHFADPVTVLL